MYEGPMLRDTRRGQVKPSASGVRASDCTHPTMAHGRQLPRTGHQMMRVLGPGSSLCPIGDVSQVKTQSFAPAYPHIWIANECSNAPVRKRSVKASEVPAQDLRQFLVSLVQFRPTSVSDVAQELSLGQCPQVPPSADKARAAALNMAARGRMIEAGDRLIDGLDECFREGDVVGVDELLRSALTILKPSTEALTGVLMYAKLGARTRSSYSRAVETLKSRLISTIGEERTANVIKYL